MSTAASGSAVLGTGDTIIVDGANSVFFAFGTSITSNALTIAPANILDVAIEFGGGISGGTARNTYLDLVADTTYTDYGVRWIRANGGANVTTEFLHRGTGSMVFKGLEANKVEFGTSNTTGLALTVNRHVVVGSGLTEPSAGLKPVLIIAQGDSATNPSGMPSNTCGIFGKNVTTTTELFTIDEAGNVTQQTPHAQDGPSWLRWEKDAMPDLIWHDENAYIGASRYTNVTLMAAALEWAMKELTKMGRTVPVEFEQFSHEDRLTDKRNWEADQIYLERERQKEIDEWDSTPENPLLAPKKPRPQPIVRKEEPEFIRTGRVRPIPPGRRIQ